MSQENPQAAALARAEPRAEVRLDAGGVQIRSVEEGMRFAKYVVASGLAPKGDNEAAVFIKLQAGLELGFTPMRALAALVVVNGRLSLDGQSTLALIRASGRARVHVYTEGEGETLAGVCELERLDTGEKAKVVFTWADAKRAGLAGKDTYKGYGADMLIWKAVARGARRYFSDILFGLEVADVASDLPPMAVRADAPARATLPPSTPDPLLAAVVGEHHSHSDVEVPLEACQHQDDKLRTDASGNIACSSCGEVVANEVVANEPAPAPDADGQGRLLEPAQKRHRG